MTYRWTRLTNSLAGSADGFNGCAPVRHSPVLCCGWPASVRQIADDGHNETGAADLYVLARSAGVWLNNPVFSCLRIENDDPISGRQHLKPGGGSLDRAYPFGV